MRIANSKEFDTWLGALIAATTEGDQLSSVKLGLVAAELADRRRLVQLGRPTRRCDHRAMEEGGSL